MSLALLCASVALTAGACADGESQGPQTLPPASLATADLVIHQPTREGSTTVVTGSLTNTGDTPVVVVGGSAYFASRIRVTGTDGGGDTNAGGPQSLAIGAKETAKLRRQGTYLELVDLTESLKSGSQVPVNLMTNNGSAITVTARVSDSR